MLKLIIFDFDGVIVDAEPLHLRAFQEVLAKEGIQLSREEYYDKYLALDDTGFFRAILRDRGRAINNETIEKLKSQKSTYYTSIIKKGQITPFPGVIDFIEKASQSYILAIGSGALREEIEFILEKLGIRKRFKEIVSAEEVERCKPAPDTFIEALNRVNRDLQNPVYPNECLVIEDSIAGIKAAHSAGMKCLAVANSYPESRLKEADIVVSSLKGITPLYLEELFSRK
ncbi:Fructose-1-phosphate phosphatase YqaB [bacterium HR37]|nr:Fructose-1-phosphate phosphatase YqaB [bacterium HR37]